MGCSRRINMTSRSGVNDQDEKEKIDLYSRIKKKEKIKTKTEIESQYLLSLENRTKNFENSYLEKRDLTRKKSFKFQSKTKRGNLVLLCLCNVLVLHFRPNIIQITSYTRFHLYRNNANRNYQSI